MGNMSYCRYQNTLADLEDCYESDDRDMSETDELSPDELEARRKLISLCMDIAEDYAEEFD